MFPRYVEETDKLERVSQLYQEIKDLEFSFPQRILHEIDDLIKEFSNTCSVSPNIGYKRTLREKCAEEFRIKRKKKSSNQQKSKKLRGLDHQKQEGNVEIKPLGGNIELPPLIKENSCHINAVSCPVKETKEQPKCDEIVETKLLKVDIDESVALKTNLSQIKEIPRRRISPFFRPSRPVIAKKMEIKTISPFFIPTKRKCYDKSTEEISSKIRKIDVIITRPKPKPVELLKLEDEFPKNEKIQSILSTFKNEFYIACKTKHHRDYGLVQTVTVTLSKCEINFQWRPRKKPKKLIIDGILIANGKTKLKCCENFVAKLGKPDTPIMNENWEKMAIECVRDIRRRLFTPFAESAAEQLTTLIPKLLTFKEILKLDEHKMANRTQLLRLMAKNCAITEFWQYDCIESGKFICDFILEGILVSEGKGNSEESALSVAFQVFLAKLDELIETGCSKIKLSSIKIDIKDFVLFQFPEADTDVVADAISALKLSAYLNGVPLTISRDFWGCTVSLGTTRIGSADSCRRKDKDNTLLKAFRYLQQNCYTIKVKNEMISSWGVKTSQMESSNFMEWNFNSLPQLFAISKPVRSEFEKYINKFANCYYVKKLVFSPNFSDDEKEEISSIAESLGLKVSNETHDEGMLLVLSGKIHPQSLVQSLLTNGNRMASDEYTLVPPSSFEGVDM